MCSYTHSGTEFHLSKPCLVQLVLQGAQTLKLIAKPLNQIKPCVFFVQFQVQIAHNGQIGRRLSIGFAMAVVNFPPGMADIHGDGFFGARLA